MIDYNLNKALEEVSRTESNGIVTVEEKIYIEHMYKGELIILVGWNGQTRKRSFLSRQSKRNNKSWSYINNKLRGTGLSNPTTDSKPTLATNSI